VINIHFQCLLHGVPPRLTWDSIEPSNGLLDETLIQRIRATAVVNAKLSDPYRDAIGAPDRFHVILEAVIRVRID
jgi:hypothetical protein